MWAVIAGAVLVIGGVLYLLRQALSKRLSDPRQSPLGPGTLEPRAQGVGFLGLRKNWPGLVAIALGALLLSSNGLTW